MKLSVSGQFNDKISNSRGVWNRSDEDSRSLNNKDGETTIVRSGSSVTDWLSRDRRFSGESDVLLN
jgi:hypothetical protein